MKQVLKKYFLGLAILGAAHMIYWRTYWKPEVFFWDENYHLASAAKYLKGVFFMEPHPPLGKLLIAFSEKILGVNNGATFNFEKFDIIPHALLDPSFSFAGYRFLPALFSIFNVLLFAVITFVLTQSYFLTAGLVTLPLFDTALILHSRGAMLDSFLLFGQLVMLLAFFTLLRLPLRSKLNPAGAMSVWVWSLIMALGFTFAVMTKVFGLALIMCWPLLYFLRKDLRPTLRWPYLVNAVVIMVLSLGIWSIHISLGKNIEPSLMNGGTYYASSDYEKWILGFEKDSWRNFPRKLYEQIAYSLTFEEHVTPLNWDEPLVTGSYPIQWPFGSRPIPYRWVKEGEGMHRYLYMIPNPWVWGMGLLGLLLSAGICIRRGRTILKSRPEIPVLLFLYFCFLIPMCFISRVLYLYHYFPMLIISWILFVLVIHEGLQTWTTKNRKILEYSLCLVPLLAFQGFFMYRNFVYYSQVDCKTVTHKFYPAFWGMKFQSCLDEAGSQRITPVNPIPTWGNGLLNPN